MTDDRLPDKIRDLVDSLRSDKGGPASLSDVAEVTEVLIATMRSFFGSIDITIYRECRALTEYINSARLEIASLSKSDQDKARIPRAGQELDAIVQHTEEATNSIMEAAEDIMSKLDGDLGDSRDDIEAAVMQIFEACSFQDITGQRISKVVEALTHTEMRLADLRDILGVTDDDIRTAETVEETMEEVAKADDDSLLHGPSLEGEGIDQSAVDALLDAGFDSGNARAGSDEDEDDYEDNDDDEGDVEDIESDELTETAEDEEKDDEERKSSERRAKAFDPFSNDDDKSDEDEAAADADDDDTKEVEEQDAVAAKSDQDEDEFGADGDEADDAADLEAGSTEDEDDLAAAAGDRDADETDEAGEAEDSGERYASLLGSDRGRIVFDDEDDDYDEGDDEDEASAEGRKPAADLSTVLLTSRGKPKREPLLPGRSKRDPDETATDSDAEDDASARRAKAQDEDEEKDEPASRSEKSDEDQGNAKSKQKLDVVRSRTTSDKDIDSLFS